MEISIRVNFIIFFIFIVEQTDNYNKQFWDRLQNEWKRISDENGPSQHPWLSEYSDYYDPYKVAK